MPQRPWGNPLTSAASTLAAGMEERAKRKRKEEEDRQKAFLESLQRKAAAGLIKGEGPELDQLRQAVEAGGISGESALYQAKLLGDAKAGAQQSNQLGAEFQNLAMGGAQGPLTAKDAALQNAYGGMEGASRRPIIEELGQRDNSSNLATMFGLNKKESDQVRELVNGGMGSVEATKYVFGLRPTPKTQTERLEDTKINERRRVWTDKGGDPESVEGRIYIYGLASPEKEDAMSTSSLAGRYAGLSGDILGRMGLQDIYKQANPGSTSDSTATFQQYVDNLRRQGVPTADKSKTVPQKAPTPEQVAEAFKGVQGDTTSQFSGISPQTFYDQAVSDSVVSSVWTQKQKDELKRLLGIQ